LSECSVSRNYLDFDTGKGEPYSCENPVWRRGKCKFHGKYYLINKNKGEFEIEFKRILDKAKSEDKALKCIGYHLPSIELSKLCQVDLDVTIYFTDAKFHGKLDFSKINFKKQISFEDSIFFETVSFSGSIFDEEVKFTNASFRGNLNSFQFTEFKKMADFSDNEIKNGKFNHAKFNIVHFNNRVFKDITAFNHASFEEENSFKQTTFYNVDFSESVFKKNADFDNTKFVDYATFSDMICYESIKFNGNISNVSFLDMDIEKIKFGNKTTWKQIKKKKNFSDKIKSRLNWTRNSDFKIYDERDLEKQIKKNKVWWKRDKEKVEVWWKREEGKEKVWWKRKKEKVEVWWKRKKNPEALVSLESIKNIYRDLRDNFDYTLRYETSGEFHVRELELKRKFQEKHEEHRIITTNRNFLWKHLSIYWLYNALAQYGQSYHRPIYFAITIISISTCYFILNEIELAMKEQMTYSITEIILKSFTRSISGIIPFDILDKGIGDGDKVLRLILLPISATFFISLKRRLERKLRH